MSDSTWREQAAQGRWSAEQAWAWDKAKGWRVGCNFVPSSAINQLEMWQAETFNPAQIDRELGWLAHLGMNSARVFLHDLLWLQDPKGFLSRLEQYLEISHRHKIGTMFVFFDSVWHPFPRLGRQPDPEPGVHNSGWVQSPGVAVLRNEKEWSRLEDYVSAILSHFRNDERIDLWDIWNEPDNPNILSYGPRDLEPAKKGDVVLPLLTKAFAWARRINPSQPLTSGIWRMDQFKPDTKKDDLPQFQLLASDVISFHIYETLASTRAIVEELKKLGRPILCTEYLARAPGNTFQQILPYFHEQKVAAYNWGAVSGKSQTIYPWDSWQGPYATEPLWQHDIFRPDGTPYDPAETALIQSLLRSK
jgi:hypothetical protein